MKKRPLDTLQCLVVSWDGPYKLEDAREFNSENGNGLYLVVGRLKRERERRALYCGITERSFARRLKEHGETGKFADVKKPEIWFGTLNFPHKCNRSHLLRIEKMMIQSREWDLTLNGPGRVSLPSPTCLLMRWYFPLNGFWQPRLRRPSFARSKPDVLRSEPDENGVHLLWSACLAHKEL